MPRCCCPGIWCVSHVVGKSRRKHGAVTHAASNGDCYPGAYGDSHSDASSHINSDAGSNRHSDAAPNIHCDTHTDSNTHTSAHAYTEFKPQSTDKMSVAAG